MRTHSTFSILFWIYSTRAKDDLAPIYVRITVNGKKLNLSLKRRIALELWDSSKQRIRGKSLKARNLNQYLDEVQSRLFQCYQELRALGKPITAKAIKNRFLGDDDNKLHTLRDIFQYHNATQFGKLHRNTSRLYLTSQKYILNFLNKQYKCSDILLQELDYKFILDFESYLRAYRPRHYQKRIGNNAVMKHIQRLRKMIRLAYRIEWIDNDPFRKFKQRLVPTHRTFLNMVELSRLENLQLNSIRLATVRDLFVFSCYTGISYVDLMALTPHNLRDGIDDNLWIVLQRQKNDNPVKIPLLQKPIDLIEKYTCDIRCLVNDSMFPRISNQKINAYLKEIATLARIDKNLTFHMARHTFATTITMSNGVPIETISKMLGHHKLSTTQIYAKVVERKVSDDMQVLRRILEPQNLPNKPAREAKHNKFET